MEDNARKMGVEIWRVKAGRSRRLEDCTEGEQVPTYTVEAQMMMVVTHMLDLLKRFRYL